jgi:DNA invertase Pin-like site-specific DNA recombinase
VLRLDGYIRVSRIGGREGEGYISPDVQREAIIAYAEELGGTIVCWHDDQDFSGGNIERPGFQAMLARLEAGETDGVVTMKVDRFARDTADGLEIVKGIIGRDQVFASCHERMDPRTKEGRYMLRQFLSNAEYFLDQISESWDTAKARAIAGGKHIGPTGIGYLKVEAVPSKPTHISPVDSAALGGPTVPGMLVPSPVYGPAVTELFDQAATGKVGDQALAHWMHAEAPRRGGAPYAASEVRRWLRNRLYLGEVRYGELVNTEAHQPLTTELTWRRAQREPGELRRAPSPFLLKGLIRCAGCRYAMGGANHGGAGQTPVYRCNRGTRGCPGPSVVTAASIEAFVIGLAKEHMRGLVLGEGAEELAVADREAIEAFEVARLEVETFVADVEARQLMGDSVWNDGLRLRVEEREARRPAYEEAIARSGTRERAGVPVEQMGRHQLRDLLTGSVLHIFVRRQARGASTAERVLIVWADDVRPILVPGPNRPGPFEPIGW